MTMLSQSIGLRSALVSFSRRSAPLQRSVSSLQGYPHIYVFPDSHALEPSSVLTLLPSEPPRRDLAIGTTTKVPPTTGSFTENAKFLRIVQEVLTIHAVGDPAVISQAQAMASPGGSGLGSGGVFFPNQRNSKRKGYGGGGGAGGDGAGGASSQGGAGSGGVGGWIHVSDTRRPPDFGRIADPEDVFGSLEVDGQGQFVGENGQYQASGTYRILTRDGLLGLSPYLREKVVQRLQEEERQGTNQ